MTHRTILLCLLLGFSLQSYCQSNKDFLLTMNKDTLFGKIKLNPKSDNIVFTIDKQKVNFHSSTIKHFGIYVDNQYHIYKSLTNKRNKSVFVEVVEEGKLNLYLYKTSKMVNNVMYKKKWYMIGRSKEKLIPLRPEVYKDSVGDFVKDAPELLVQLDESQYGDIPELITSYNRL